MIRPSAEPHAATVREEGRRACHAGLPPTLNPYHRRDAPRAWLLWRQGWRLGQEERAEADVELLEVCDDCATCIGTDRDPEGRPGLGAQLAARWPGCDLVLVDEASDPDPDDGRDDPAEETPLISQEPCPGCGTPSAGPRWPAVAHRRPSSPSPAGPPRPLDGLVRLADIMAALPAARDGDAAAAGPEPEAAALRLLEERLLAAVAGGCSRGQLIMLTGQPRTGRTSLALQLAAAAAARRGGAVAWFSHQAAAPEVALHLLASRSGLAIQDLQGEAAVLGAADAARALACLPLHIDDEPELAVATVQERCLVLAGESSLALVVIDTVELMRRRCSAPSYQAALIPVMHDLRTMARTLDVPVLIVSTLSRRHPVDQQGQPDADPEQLDPHDVCDRVLLLHRVDQAAVLLPVRLADLPIRLRFDVVRLRFTEPGSAGP